MAGSTAVAGERYKNDSGGWRANADLELLYRAQASFFLGAQNKNTNSTLPRCSIFAVYSSLLVKHRIRRNRERKFRDARGSRIRPRMRARRA